MINTDVSVLLKLNAVDYNFVIEGNGRLIKDEKGYNIYSHEELIKDENDNDFILAENILLFENLK